MVIIVFNLCSSLLGLRLRCCEITDDSVISLSAVLKKNPPLQQLDLSCNNIGDDGVKALSGALRVNNNLLVISLANNDIGDVGAAFLFEVSLFNPRTSLSLVPIDCYHFVSIPSYLYYRL